MNPLTDATRGVSSALPLLRRSTLRTLIASVLVLLVACTTTEGGKRDNTPVTGQGNSSGAPVAVPVSNTRILFYQRSQDLLIVLVNESHELRKTEKGRLALALNDSDRVYKVLSDQQMAGLLTSLENYGFGTEADPFTDNDAVYLTRGSAEIPRFQGIVMVERDGIRRKFLGIRAGNSADAVSHARYKSYVDFKTLITLKFQATSNAEAPIGGVIMPADRGR